MAMVSAAATAAVGRLAQPGKGTLEGDEIHVWLVAPQQVTGRDRDRCDALLSDAEARRRDGYLFERDRHTQRVTCALVRTCLSQYSQVPPWQWRFEANAHGRPFVSPDLLAAPLDFNVSHTEGLVACAVSRRPEVGIDTEARSRLHNPVELAEAVFSPVEIEQLQRASARSQRRLFFELWTLKEAYIKARGLGLSLPLDKFWFDREAPGPIRVAIAEELADNPSSWHFELYEPTPEHQLALAARCGSPVRVQVRSLTPSFVYE